MATELAFAKSFLGLLDTKPSKISPDHVEDPRTYPGISPYTLPRHPSLKPLSKKPRLSPPSSTSQPTTTSQPSSSSSSQDAAPAQQKQITIHLRSPRNPPWSDSLTLPLESLHIQSVADLKEVVATRTGLPIAKVKLLYNKKPVGADSKVLKDIIGEEVKEGAEFEFGVMILGGGTVIAPKVASPSPSVKEEEETQKTKEEVKNVVAQGPSGREVLATEQFWGDLHGFLQQRVKDEAVAAEACEVFRGAWKGR